MAQEIDTLNRQMVGLHGNEIVVMKPKVTMSKSEALVHAAWLVALADDDGTFNDVYNEVLNT